MVASTAGVSSPLALKAKSKNKKNVVLILADDVSTDMFSCYNQPGTAKTPHIDRLGEKGVFFETCFAPAICGPSRALIMTGNYANTTGVYHNGIWKNDSRGSLFTKQHSWAKLISKNGYKTAIAGKWHCGAKMPWEEAVGFDEYCLWEGPKKIMSHTGIDVYAKGLRKKTDQRDVRYWHPSIYRNGKYVPVKLSDFGPDICSDFIMDFMERMSKKDQPFVAYWPTAIPHGPYSTTPHAGEVGDLELKKPDTKGLKGEKKEAVVQKYNEAQKKRFINLIEYMDHLIGKIIKKTEDLGIMENTYIVFCADNGTAITAKNRGVERGSHVPFAVVGPGVKKRGRSMELMDFSDVAPTLLEMTGTKHPENFKFDGQSLVPYITGKNKGHRDWIYSYVGTSQLVRTKNYLLEVVNPVFDLPEGRFYYTSDNRFGKGYQLINKSAEHQAARKKFDEILKKLPSLQKADPYWQSKKGKGWLKSNATPESIDKHLHNHPDYRFYEE
jgi:arylsulfatase A-like enzyme